MTTDLLTPLHEAVLATHVEAGVVAARLLADPDLRARFPPATDAELSALVDAGERARQRFVAANVRLAAWEAHRWAARERLDVEELVQEGCVGLIEAVDRWDHTEGTRFAGYAIHWIRKRVRTAAATRCGTVALSETGALQLRRGLRDQTLDTQARALLTAASLDNDDLAPIAVPAPQAETDDDTVAAALACLGPRERRVVLLRHGWDGAPLSCREIARRTGWSRRDVARLERQAVLRMQAALVDDAAVA